MSNDIQFYFDYSSPYGYLASERIEAIAGDLGRSVVWRPILLGAIFRITGQAPLIEAPLKGDYSLRDFNRSAREHKLDFRFPDKFPIGAVAASRATVWLRDNEDVQLQHKTGDFIHALYRAYFIDGKDITEPSVVAAEAAALGIDTGDLQSALAGQALKDALKTEVEQAIAAGVFGSPTLIVDNEPFWGHDRLEQMQRWVQLGGW